MSNGLLGHQKGEDLGHIASSDGGVFPLDLFLHLDFQGSKGKETDEQDTSNDHGEAWDCAHPTRSHAFLSWRFEFLPPMTFGGRNRTLERPLEFTESPKPIKGIFR